VDEEDTKAMRKRKEMTMVKKQPPVPRMAYTISEFATMLGVSSQSAWRRVNDGTISSIWFGHRRLIPKEEIDRVLEGLKG
jgi:excisionase family DNA binding protein